MTFPEDIVQEAWTRSGGKCECVKVSHAHPYVRCNKKLVWSHRYMDIEGGWEDYRSNKFAGNVVSNCRIICIACARRIEGRY